MRVANSPAVLVICGTVDGPGSLGRRQAIGLQHAGALPVTWLAAVDRLGAVAEAAGPHHVALQVPTEAFATRQALRSLLARGREAVPGLSAIAMDQSAAITHRDLLVEEGVRVVLVDRLVGGTRGSRRPAPVGWRCRNAAWSLWEVEIDAPRSPGPLAALGLGRGPRVRRGGLSVVSTSGIGPAGDLHPRLQRLVAWARRLAERGVATAVSLSGLVARLGGEDHTALAGSVLRAA
jgi:hypothetical protein